MQPTPEVIVDISPGPRDFPSWHTYYNNQQFSDVVLVAGDGVQFYGHRIVLAGFSEPLAAMLGGGENLDSQEKGRRPSTHPRIHPCIKSSQRRASCQFDSFATRMRVPRWTRIRA
jgi:hypothetical protein